MTNNCASELLEFQQNYSQQLYDLLKKRKINGEWVLGLDLPETSTISTIETMLSEIGQGSVLYEFSPSKVFGGQIQIKWYKTANETTWNRDFSIIVTLETPKPTKPDSPKKLIKQIVKKFSLSDLEKAILNQYISYMNDEGKIPFLSKVLAGDREYLEQFVNTDLEDFGNEQFEEKLDYNGRKENVDMYDMVEKNDEKNILLLYKGVIMRLGELDKETRREVYIDTFKVNPEKYNAEDVLGKRSIVYNRYLKYIKKLSRPQLEKFIDDVFDKQTKIFGEAKEPKVKTKEEYMDEISKGLNNDKITSDGVLDLMRLTIDFNIKYPNEKFRKMIIKKLNESLTSDKFNRKQMVELRKMLNKQLQVDQIPGIVE